MFHTFLLISLLILALSILVSLYRVFKGPSMPDRVMALDAIGINLVATVAILSVMFRTHAFMDILLLVGILSFIGTIAFARFLERGVAIAHRRD